MTRTKLSKWLPAFLAISVALIVQGCGSAGTPRSKVAEVETTAISTSRPYGMDLKSRLNYIVDHKISQTEAIRVLDNFVLGDYDIQDQKTFWGHRAVGSSSFSEYYLTYRSKYFIMFLRDNDNAMHSCIDLRMIAKTNKDYELSTGKVEVDGGQIDEAIVVLFNKNWTASYSTDILAAFRPNVETGKIEEVQYKTIRIYREG